MKRFAARALGLGLAILSISAIARPDPGIGPLYKNPHAPVEARVEDLLARMTLEEKIAQIVTLWEAKRDIMDARGEFDPAKMRVKYPNGLGQFARPSDAAGPMLSRNDVGRDAVATVRLVNAMQRYAMTRTRLGIPILMHEEGLHGYAAVGATSFPQPIAMASTFDPDLVRAVNGVTAREMRARGVSLALSPVVDVARDPRWGRIEETFGEDPYLVGEMGVAAVEGLQGPGRTTALGPDKVFATLKHLAGHGQPESGTNTGPAPFGARTLREYFLPPFEQVIRRTGIQAVMASYNEIDGIPSHANTWLLGDVLRGEWGFSGVVLSDYNGIEDLARRHHVAADTADAALLALAAGVDSDLPSGASYSTLLASVRSGRVGEAAVDVAVRRILTLKFRAGLFENPYADASRAVVLTNNADARAIARKAAQRAVILLKNDGVLPLRLDGARPRIAVIGPNAAAIRLGGYSGVPVAPVTLLDGIRRRVGSRADIVYAPGVNITKDDDWFVDKVELADPAENRRLIAQAVDTARTADQIILALGDTEQTSREAWVDGHLGDRDSLELVGQQQELFDALRALGKPVTVILLNGRPPTINRIAEEANAILEGWYLGEQGGNALSDVLFGDVNPGGKLPVTIPRSVGQLPYFYNYKPTARRGYLFADKSPLYPFGFGLSYTRFTLAPPRISATTIATNGSVDVTVRVTNAGTRSGDEIVQLYVHQMIGSVTRSVMDMRAFRRVTLSPGETRNVTFTLTPQSFAMWNAKMRRIVEPGQFQIMTGNSSAQLQTAMLKIVQ